MDRQLLKGYIVLNDGSQRVLAKAMGLSLSRLNAKITNYRGAQFTQSEIDFIAQRYSLSKSATFKVFF